MLEIRPNNKNWHTRGDDTKARLDAAACLAKGKIVDAKDTVALLEAVLHPGDNVNIEGDNQKQADFLAGELCKVDPNGTGRKHRTGRDSYLSGNVQPLLYRPDSESVSSCS